MKRILLSELLSTLDSAIFKSLESNSNIINSNIESILSSNPELNYDTLFKIINCNNEYLYKSIVKGVTATFCKYFPIENDMKK